MATPFVACKSRGLARPAPRAAAAAPSPWLVDRIDHAVWQVGDLDRCLEMVVVRMGFPVLRPLVETGGLRFADVAFGGLSVRLMETRGGARADGGGYLRTLALEVAQPLETALAGVRRRGFFAGEIHTARGPVGGRATGPSSRFRFARVRGVVRPLEDPLTSGVVLVDRSGEERPGDGGAFPGSAAEEMAGVTGAVWLTAETDEESGRERWDRFLAPWRAVGEGDDAVWALGAGPWLRVIPGPENGFRSLTLGCWDMRILARHLHSCRVPMAGCCGGIVVGPESTGGVALRFLGPRG